MRHKDGADARRSGKKTGKREKKDKKNERRNSTDATSLSIGYLCYRAARKQASENTDNPHRQPNRNVQRQRMPHEFQTGPPFFGFILSFTKIVPSCA